MSISRLAPFALLFIAACPPPGSYGNWNNGGAAGGAPAPGAGEPGQAADSGGQPAGPPPEALQGASLTQLTTDDDNESNPTVSPDGKTLLFVDWTNEVVDGQYTGNVATRSIVGMSPDGGTGRTVYTSSRSQAYGPTWTSDGKGFVFMSDSMGNWNLVRSLSRSPSAATSVVARGDDAPEIVGVNASPVEKRVAFDTNLRGTRQIVVSGLDGSSFTVLTTGENPRWSPDGKRLAFDRLDNDVRHIYLIDAETGDNLVQLTNGTTDDYDPAWAPDGNTIVYASNYGYDQWQNGTKDTANLFAIHTDGTAYTQVTTGIATSREPEWAANGWVYFSSNTGGNYDLFRVAAPQL